MNKDKKYGKCVIVCHDGVEHPTNIPDNIEEIELGIIDKIVDVPTKITAKKKQKKEYRKSSKFH